MSLYEPEQVSAWLLSTLGGDADLLSLAVGGVFDTDTTDKDQPEEEYRPTTGTAKERQATPYVVFSLLAGGADTQGAGGTILFADMDYSVQVLYRPGQSATARAALRRIQTLLEGVEATVAASGDVSAHGILVRGASVLPRTRDSEPGGRLLYSEGRRWRINLHRIEE